MTELTQKDDLHQFKILAIRPHSDCDSKYSKVLQKGRLYQLYNGYVFSDANSQPVAPEGSVVNCISSRNVPAGLYAVDSLQVNISAIVGKNGSGKSTLLELLLYTIYIMGTQTTDATGIATLSPHHIQLAKLLDEKNAELQYLQEQREKLVALYQKPTVDINTIDYKIGELLTLITKVGNLHTDINTLEGHLLDAEAEHDHIVSHMNCSIFFELAGIIWEFNTAVMSGRALPDTKSMEGNVKLLTREDCETGDLVLNFFYSIVLNYSHYALNSKYLGYWINTLFHKNDGYKTPVVINPMRNEGNFDINREILLSKYRLLANIAAEALLTRKEKIAITEKQYVHKIRFRFIPSPDDDSIKLGLPGSADEAENFVISGPMNAVALIRELVPIYFTNYLEEAEVHNKNLPYAAPLINYLSRKVPKIFRNYPEYEPRDKFVALIDLFRKALPIIRDDKSHVTFKVSRVMYFLKKMLQAESRTTWDTENPYVDFTVTELLEWMEVKSTDDMHLIFERMPPSKFDVEFILDSSDSVIAHEPKEEEKLPKFTDLSSGEQQKLFTITTALYQLNNIYSVHRSSDKVQRTKYRYVNIIFDEIELYFHPDQQRNFINDLRNAIKRLGHITRDPDRTILALNIIFSTHSPFILSDIPSENILRLSYRKKAMASLPETEAYQTFAANIHQLLANNFFLSDQRLIGEFAYEFIESLIERIAVYRAERSLLTADRYEEINREIKIIGEPFFRKKLMEMINEIWNKP